MATSSTPTGVVLDAVRTRALLFAAIKERLVDDDPVIGDGFVRHILDRPPHPQVLEEAFEQLVLGGRIYSPLWIPNEWEGGLFTDEVIVPIKTPITEEDLIPVSQYPAEALVGLLNETPGDWTAERIAGVIEHFQECVLRWETEGKGKKLGTLEFLGLLESFGLKSVLPDYSNREHELWKAVNAARHAVQPILAAMKEYRTIISEAIQLSALAAVPSVVSPGSGTVSGELRNTTLSQHILKVTCKQLGRTPIRPSLAETITLATSAEAAALREKMHVWTDALYKGEIKDLGDVIAEVRQAQQRLSDARRASDVSDFATWISFSSLFLSEFSALATGAGLVATVVGGISSATSKTLSAPYRWAMFGHSH